MAFRSLGEAVLATASAHPSRPALWAKGQSLTYSELAGKASRIAAAITRSSGFTPGNRVAILANRTETLYVAILGALIAGAAYVPLNPRFPIARNRAILSRSEATVLVVDEAHQPVTGELTEGLALLPAIIRAGALANGGSAATPVCADNPGGLAYVFFTSGSTGEPKGVPIRHSSVFAYLDGIRDYFAPSPQDRILQLVDVTFDLSVHDIFLTWTSGACLYSVPENAVLLCSRFVEEHEITSWLSVPSTAGLIKQAGMLDPGSMPSLTHSFFCGEALPGPVAAAWAAAASNAQVINIYGPTEATIAISAFRCDTASLSQMDIVPLGHPLGEQKMALFDPEGRPTATGEIGEICLAGSQLSDGYWRAPDLTAERFFEAQGDRWYRTGDLGTFATEVGFIYRGRADHQVKLRGYRVELQEIEAVVRAASGSDLVAVVPWPMSKTGQAMGCVAFTLPLSTEPVAVLAACADKLPDYMLPSRIIQISEFPLNPNGKVDYPRLRLHPELATSHD